MYNTQGSPPHIIITWCKILRMQTHDLPFMGRRGHREPKPVLVQGSGFLVTLSWPSWGFHLPFIYRSSLFLLQLLDKYYKLLKFFQPGRKHFGIIPVNHRLTMITEITFRSWKTSNFRQPYIVLERGHNQRINVSCFCFWLKHQHFWVGGMFQPFAAMMHRWTTVVQNKYTLTFFYRQHGSV